jgi:pimeloyl-ACP methyl ester carboxylesterase
MRFAAGVDARGSGIEDHWLFGRSDDGSIALLYASRFPRKTSGVVVAAPHIHVGNITVESIRQAREACLTQGLRATTPMWIPL